MNLKTGVPDDCINETCTAGAGSLLVEFGILSRLIGDSTFEWVARRAVRALWSLRNNETGLLGMYSFHCKHCRAAKAINKYMTTSLKHLVLWNSVGNVVNIQTGQWVGKQSGLGAGMDSFYEYLLKSYILFGEKEDYRMFQAAYESIQNHMRRGWVPYQNNATVLLKWNLGGGRSKCCRHQGVSHLRPDLVAVILRGKFQK